jgi:hypothetical protein
MIKLTFVTFPALSLLLLLTPIARSQADPPIAVPNAVGDYFTNLGQERGSVPQGSKLSPGSLWRVVSPGLNCRAKPDSKSAIVRQFRQGQVVQIYLGRGGSDEVFQNAIDRDGKPWMGVMSPTGENYNCNVRANRKYIRPVSPLR